MARLGELHAAESNAATNTGINAVALKGGMILLKPMHCRMFQPHRDKRSLLVKRGCRKLDQNHPFRGGERPDATLKAFVRSGHYTSWKERILPRIAFAALIAAGVLAISPALSQERVTVVPAPEAPPSRKVELAPSPLPRSLESPLPRSKGLSDEAARLLRLISLCDPTPCLGQAPRLVFADGEWTISFPASYQKPPAETKDLRQKNPAPRDKQ
jgi:hypothetical protein